MLKQDQIIHLIKSNNCPFWKLFMQEDRYSRGNIICNYNGENIKQDDKDETAIELSIKALQSQLSIYEDVPGLIFSIIIRPTSTSNKDQVLGPYIFKLNDQSFERPLNGIPGQNQNFDQMGYVPKNQMEQMMDLMSQKSALLLEKALFERDKAAFYDDKKIAEEELKGLAKEYSNVYNAAKSASKKGVMKAGLQIAKTLGWIDADTNIDGLDDEEKPAEVNNENDTPEEKAAIKVAEVLVESKLSASDIEGINQLVIKIIEKKKNDGIKTNEEN